MTKEQPIFIAQKHLQAVTRSLLGKDVAPVGELLDKIESLKPKITEKEYDLQLLNEQLREACKAIQCLDISDFPLSVIRQLNAALAAAEGGE